LDSNSTSSGLQPRTANSDLANAGGMYHMHPLGRRHPEILTAASSESSRNTLTVGSSHEYGHSALFAETGHSSSVTVQAPTHSSPKGSTDRLRSAPHTNSSPEGSTDRFRSDTSLEANNAGGTSFEMNDAATSNFSRPDTFSEVNDTVASRFSRPDTSLDMNATGASIFSRPDTSLEAGANNNTASSSCGLSSISESTHDTLGSSQLGSAYQLHRTDLGKIPSKKVKRGRGGMICAICTSPISVGERKRTLTCGHEFHARCVQKWLKNNITCPMCRSEQPVHSKKSEIMVP